MKKIEKVITYNKRPKDFEFDGKRVYLNKNIKEDTQNDVICMKWRFMKKMSS